MLLKKICDHEAKEEAIAKGLISEELLNELSDAPATYPAKKPFPLIKTMYIRDPSRSNFKIQKYSRSQLESDPTFLSEALADIKYDQYLKPKPSFLERLHNEYRTFML